MSDNSKIEWTDATWNVVLGCDRVSPGCDSCYAIRTAHRMAANPNPKITAAYDGLVATRTGRLDWTGRVNLVEDRLSLPLHWSRPRRIFVNAQSDLFHADVPDEFIARVWAVMAATPQHTYQVLTKRHGRMRSLLSNERWLVQVGDAGHAAGLGDVDGLLAGPWPLPNVWLGVSVEDQKRADLRIPALLATPAAVRFLSCEPLLGPVLLRDWVQEPCGCCPDRLGRECVGEPGQRSVDWVIVGGESGPGARPMPSDWARELRDQCQRTAVPFFFKQWGESAPLCQLPPAALASWEIRNGVGYPPSTHCHVGKKAAGRELDGRTWDELPVVAS